MDILVLNSGSSSLKYQLFDMTTENTTAKGLIERIGLKDSIVNHEPEGKEKVKKTIDIENHEKALKIVLDLLVDPKDGVIKSLDDINAIGHRVVHGGENFSESALITDEVFKAIEDCEPLAPLHNPANKAGIVACKDIMPDKPQVAVFDTAFHQTMTPANYLYALPYEYYEKYKIRRYGFHGTSHKYVAFRGAEYLGKDIKDLKIITVHIGNGGSITAIKGGEVIDTSMGFTPLEGLVMGTRCGNIDPAIIFFLMAQDSELTSLELDKIMNKQSGLLGVSGVSSDMRDITAAAEHGNKRAQYALDLFENRVIKYIGEYTALLDGCDAIIFTAGIGENAIDIREHLVERLGWLGVKLDKEANNVRGKEATISTADSKTKVLVIPTNEEYMIAKDTYDIVSKKK